MKKLWKNNKWKSLFVGSYERDRKGERIFVLNKANGARRITFESWQSAKKNGWVKQ